MSRVSEPLHTAPQNTEGPSFRDEPPDSKSPQWPSENKHLNPTKVGGITFWGLGFRHEDGMHTATQVRTPCLNNVGIK
jgi:hypothetical protein